MALAADTKVATASNFKVTLTKLITEFNNDDISYSFASTGKLTAQINRGAPFDIFLSADVIGGHVAKDKIISDSEFTYAKGQLALVTQNAATLDEAQHIDCVAIANPTVAPYGRAANEALERFRQQGWTFKRVVQGQSVAQAFQFFDSGACESALVAYAQVLAHPKTSKHFVIPNDWHAPIKQNAVLLKRAEHNATAIQFLEFLKSATARKIIRDAGYLLEEE